MGTKPSNYLPSEIGRLVYGYLGKIRCPKTRTFFLEENAELRELHSLVEKKLLRSIEMEIDGLNLEDLLNEHAMLKYNLDLLFDELASKRPTLSDYKSVRSLRKLEILSNHWRKNAESNIPMQQRQSMRQMMMSRRRMSQEERTLADERAKMALERHLKSKQNLSLASKSSESSPTEKEEPKANHRNRKHRALHLISETERRAADEEVQRALSKSSRALFSGTNLTTTRTPSTTTPSTSIFHSRPRITYQSCCTDVPSSAETSKPGDSITSSPHKSRKSTALKSKIPTKCNSMPVIVDLDAVNADVRKKIGAFTQHSDDNIMNTLLGEPLANILASSNTVNIDVAVENFLSNPELFDNFTHVLDEVWEADCSNKQRSSSSKASRGSLTTPPHHPGALSESQYENSIEGNSSLNQDEALFPDLSTNQNVDLYDNHDGGVVDNNDVGDVDAIDNSMEECHVEYNPSQNSEYSIRVLLPVKESADPESSSNSQPVSVSNQTSENIEIFQVLENSGVDQSQQLGKDDLDSSDGENLTVAENESLQKNLDVACEKSPPDDSEMQRHHTNENQSEDTEDLPDDRNVKLKEIDKPNLLDNNQSALEHQESKENSGNQTESDPEVQSNPETNLSEESTSQTDVLGASSHPASTNDDFGNAIEFSAMRAPEVEPVKLPAAASLIPVIPSVTIIPVVSATSRSQPPCDSQLFGSQQASLQPVSPFLTPARSSSGFSFQLLPLKQQEQQHPAAPSATPPLSSSPLFSLTRFQTSGPEPTLDPVGISINRPIRCSDKSSKRRRQQNFGSRSAILTRSRRKLNPPDKSSHAESGTTPLRSQNSLNCNDDKGNTDLSNQNISHGEIQNPAESFVGHISQGEHLLVERDNNDSVVDAESSICTIGYIDVSSIEVITALPSSQPIDISEVAILGDADAVTSSTEQPKRVCGQIKDVVDSPQRNCGVTENRSGFAGKFWREKNDSKLLTTFRASFNAVMLTDSKNLQLVNHLTGVEERSPLELVLEFLQSNIFTVEDLNEAGVMTGLEKDCFDQSVFEKVFLKHEDNGGPVEHEEHEGQEEDRAEDVSQTSKRTSLLLPQSENGLERQQLLPTSFMNVLEEKESMGSNVNSTGQARCLPMTSPMSADPSLDESSNLLQLNSYERLKSRLPLSVETTPNKPDQEENSLITPPSESYHAKENRSNTGSETTASPDLKSVTPGKRVQAEVDHPTPFTPLKALKEAIKLATPSPIKHRVFHGSHTATPTKDGSSGQSTLVHTTPVKWYKVQRKTTTPLKGLNEAVLKLAESVNVEVDLVSPAKTPSKKCSGTVIEHHAAVSNLPTTPLKTSHGNGGLLQTASPTKDIGETVRYLIERGEVKNKNYVFVSPSKQCGTSANPFDSPVKRDISNDFGPKQKVVQSSAPAFVSPSKRAPKRAVLSRVVDQPDRVKPGEFCSKWEALHDVNNLDNYSIRTTTAIDETDDQFSSQDCETLYSQESDQPNNAMNTLSSKTEFTSLAATQTSTSAMYASSETSGSLDLFINDSDDDVVLQSGQTQNRKCSTQKTLQEVNTNLALPAKSRLSGSSSIQNQASKDSSVKRVRTTSQTREVSQNKPLKKHEAHSETLAVLDKAKEWDSAIRNSLNLTADNEQRDRTSLSPRKRRFSSRKQSPTMPKIGTPIKDPASSKTSSRKRRMSNATTTTTPTPVKASKKREREAVCVDHDDSAVMWKTPNSKRKRSPNQNRLIVKISPRKLTWSGRTVRENTTPDNTSKPDDSSPIQTNLIKPFSLEDDLELSVTQGSPFKTRTENLQEETKSKEDLEEVSFLKFKDSMTQNELESEEIISSIERFNTEITADKTVTIDEEDKSTKSCSKENVQQSKNHDARLLDDKTQVYRSETNQDFTPKKFENEGSQSFPHIVEKSSSTPSKEVKNLSTSGDKKKEEDKLIIPPLVPSFEQTLKQISNEERTDSKLKLTLSEMQIYFDQSPFAEESSLESEENDSS